LTSSRFPTGTDLHDQERRLHALAKRIDPVLRRHYARHAVLRLVTPPKFQREVGVRPRLWMSARWVGKALVWLLVLGAALHYGPTLVGLFSDYRGAWLRYWLPDPHWAWLPAAAAGLLLFERLPWPRIALSTHRFRLMRLEREDAGVAEFPDLYRVAKLDGGIAGFGWQHWRALSGVRAGDIVVAISDRRDRGLALIPLRTRGRLTMVGWDRDVVMYDALPPLPEAVRALAQEFDQACELCARIAEPLERSSALRSGNIVEPPPVDPAAAWAPVILAEPVKRRLQALAAHFDRGSRAAARGLLLYGPPGTGKTLIARTFAESMRCAFFPLSLPDLKSGYVGQSGENVRALWRKALATPRAVIFVDECDSVFGRRGGAQTDSFVEDIVAAFLAEWDGFQTHSHVWVVGATNRRDQIDAAIVSRFEEQLEIGLPDAPQRTEILRRALQALDVTVALPDSAGALTDGMSGRELATLAKRLAREIDGGPGSPSPAMIDAAALERHTREMRRQGGTVTASDARWDSLVLPADTLTDLQTTAGLLQHAETFRARGIGVPRGLLLYGPPGTGKTQIARTLANETGLRFIAATTADIKQGFVGQSGQKVRELFERARESAPSLLFIDEIDILASARGGAGDNFQTEILGQLLQEMDGVQAQTQPVFVLAATNRIDQLDPALLSRLPKQIEIPLPDREAAARILAVLLRGKPVEFDVESTCTRLAEDAAGRSGRDLRSWVESAEHRAVARAIREGDPASVRLRVEDFAG